VTDTLAAQLSDIFAHFKHVTGIENWVGTVGMGICGSGCEYFDDGLIRFLSTKQ